MTIEEMLGRKAKGGDIGELSQRSSEQMRNETEKLLGKITEETMLAGKARSENVNRLKRKYEEEIRAEDAERLSRKEPREIIIGSNSSRTPKEAFCDMMQQMYIELLRSDNELRAAYDKLCSVCESADDEMKRIVSKKIGDFEAEWQFTKVMISPNVPETRKLFRDSIIWSINHYMVTNGLN